MKQIISILICAWFATTINAQSLSKEAKILFEIRPKVNYVTHLYTLAGLGFADEEYTAKYGSTLPKAAVDTLQKYKDYLVFGQGEGGMWHKSIRK